MFRSHILSLLFLILCTALGAQDSTRLVLRDVSVREAIREIREWSGYAFVWESQDVDTETVVSIDADKLETALDQLFKGQEVAYTIGGGTIVISRKDGADILIQGLVRSPDGTPLEGVVVLNMLTSKGVLTTSDGRFHMKAAPEVPLSFSYLGYSTVHLPAATDMDVSLEEDFIPLEESVFIGYGSIGRNNLTGAVSTISSADLSQRTAPTLGHMLQGSVTGMFVQSNSGVPNDVPSMTIRGVPSINGGQPLVLIDGVEGDMSKISPSDVQSVSVIKDASASAVYGAKASFGVVLVTTRTGSSDALRPTVRYSARAGFSTPTTRTDFETRGYDSVYLSDLFMRESTGRNYTYYTNADREQLLARRNDVTENPKRPWVLQEERNGRLSWIYYCNTDWYHSMYRDVNPLQNQSVSITGGGGPLSYYLSATYDGRRGIFKSRPDSYGKFSILSKTSYELTPQLSFSSRISFFTSSYDYPGNRSPDNTFGFSSVHGLASFPLKNPDGTWVYRTIFNNFNLTNGCHIEMGEDAKSNRQDTYQFSTTASLVWKPSDSLNLNADATVTLDSVRECFRWAGMDYSLYPGEVLHEETGRFMNRLEDYNYLSPYYDVSFWGKYSPAMEGGHNLSVTAGFNAQRYSYKRIYTYADNIGSSTVSDYNLKQAYPDGTFRMDIQGGQAVHSTAGFFSRVNYDYKGKYLLEVSSRLDGSSAFAESSRWGFFPSVSLGWVFTREAFWKDAPLKLNSGKLRLSLGQLGNQQVSDYQWMRRVVVSSVPYLLENEGSLPTGAAITAPNSANLTWETIRHYDLGTDLSWCEGRLGATADVFVRETLNMLTEGEDLPSVYGAPSPLENRADLRSQGYEVSLTYRDRADVGGKALKYSVTASLTDYITKITRFGNTSKVLGSHYVGETIGEIWGFRVDGLFASDAEAEAYTDYDNGGVDQSFISGGLRGGWKGGDLKFRDLDHDRIISKGGYTVDESGDLEIIGNSLPRWQYGLTLSAVWGGFDFSAFIQGVGRINWYPGPDNTAFWGPYSRPYGTFYQKDFLDKCWSTDNTGAYFPRTRGMVAMEGTTQLTEPNDRYLQNLGYMRLKNLTMGWSLPSKSARKLSLEALRLYITAENVFYFSPLSKVTRYIDPEALYVNGAYGWTYPWQRPLVLGIDISF